MGVKSWLCESILPYTDTPILPYLDCKPPLLMTNHKLNTEH